MGDQDKNLVSVRVVLERYSQDSIDMFGCQLHPYCLELITGSDTVSLTLSASDTLHILLINYVSYD